MSVAFLELLRPKTGQMVVLARRGPLARSADDSTFDELPLLHLEWRREGWGEEAPVMFLLFCFG